MRILSFITSLWTRLFRRPASPSTIAPGIGQALPPGRLAPVVPFQRGPALLRPGWNPKRDYRKRTDDRPRHVPTYCQGCGLRVDVPPYPTLGLSKCECGGKFASRLAELAVGMRDPV